MDPHKPRPWGQSKSMPLLPSYTEGEADQDHAMEQSWAQVLQEIQESPGYHLLRDSGSNTPPLPRRYENGPPTHISYSDQRDEGESLSSPRSGHTIRPGDMLESGGIAVTPTRSSYPEEPSATKSMGLRVIGDESLGHGSVPHLAPRAPVFHPTIHLGNATLSERTDTTQEGQVEYSVAYSDPQGTTEQHDSTQGFIDCSSTPFCGNIDMGSPVKNKNADSASSIEKFSAIGAARGVTQSTPNARGPIHHRRTSSKFAFVPVQPSPLGSGRFTDHLNSDVSGLMSPVTSTAPRIQIPNPQWNSALAPRTANAATPAAVPFSWTQSTPESFTPFDLSPVNDPFLEHRPSIETTGSEFTPLRRRAPTPTTPQRRKPSQDEICHPVTGLSIHDARPIPPPSLPIIQSVRGPSLESRARLDAEKPLRKQWIETEARRLAALAHNAAFYKKQYELAKSSEAYEAWNNALTLFRKAWDVERLTEERRNLTLPEGMKALKMGPDNLPSDGMGKQGGLPGYNMALMERICAEVVMKKEDWEMLAEEMDEDAKMAVRKAVMKDVTESLKKGEERLKKKKDVSDDELAEDRTIPVFPSMES